MSRFGVFKIEGVSYDLDDMTLDEMELIEETCGGVPFGELNFAAAKTMKAIAWTLLRRNDPEITMEAIGGIKMIDMLPADEKEPPLPPEDGEATNGSGHVDSGAPASPASTTG